MTSTAPVERQLNQQLHFLPTTRLAYMFRPVIALLLVTSVPMHCVSLLPSADFTLRQCEPIRIEMCRGIGYNETSMPNLVGHELQSEVEFTLQTFAPLVEYLCSSQLKLFLCASYVPMCTSKIPVPIGPCRSLCESVHSRCHPVLQGFGFPWPPALDCNLFPKENNQDSMCMEGPGETHSSEPESELYPGLNAGKTPVNMPPLECPGLVKSHLYRKLHRSGRCSPLCDADILFGQHEKHLAEVWVATWTYATLTLAAVTTLCLVLGADNKNGAKWTSMLTALVWCHNIVTVGWTVRFVSGRTATACGFDPQLPHVSLLLTDGLSNAACAATFLLRYYFGMAACVWWAILCLGWHRDVRRISPDMNTGHVALASSCTTQLSHQRKRTSRRQYDITQSNMARFAAWFLPALQTAAVIVARVVDADELLGACFVGNQSDKGLQILVATPLFCYWIFGSVNLISGYLVHRRSKEILHSLGPFNYQPATGAANSGIGTFLFIYCIPFAVLLTAVIYEFTNIDVWLNVSAYITATEGITTPLWPFLTRAFMELILSIICCAWILGPEISTIYKRQLVPRPIKHATTTSVSIIPQKSNGRVSNLTYSTASYQTVRHQSTARPHSSATISLHQMGRFKRSLSVSPVPSASQAQPCIHTSSHKQAPPVHRYGNETIF